MKKISILLSLLGFGASTLMFQSCLNDDNSVDLMETAAPDRAEPRDGLDQSHVSDVEWQEQSIVVVPNDYEE